MHAHAILAFQKICLGSQPSFHLQMFVVVVGDLKAQCYTLKLFNYHRLGNRFIGLISVLFYLPACLNREQIEPIWRSSETSLRSKPCVIQWDLLPGKSLQDCKTSFPSCFRWNKVSGSNILLCHTDEEVDDITLSGNPS